MPRKKQKSLEATLKEMLAETRKEINILQSKNRKPYEESRLLQLKMHREGLKEVLKVRIWTST